MADYDPRSRSSSLCVTDSADDTVSDSAAERADERLHASSPPVPASAPPPASVDLARRRLATKRAYRATMRTLTQWAAVFELTPARFEMLAAIASHPLGTTQRTLSQALSISQGTTSRMVARLVRLGLVQVSPNPDDARKRLLVVSEEGQRRLTAAQSSFFDGGFGAPDPELLN